MVTVTLYQTTVTKAGDPGNGPNSYPLTTSVLLEVLLTAAVQVRLLDVFLLPGLTRQ